MMPEHTENLEVEGRALGSSWPSFLGLLMREEGDPSVRTGAGVEFHIRCFSLAPEARSLLPAWLPNDRATAWRESQGDLALSQGLVVLGKMGRGCRGPALWRVERCLLVPLTACPPKPG